MAPLRPALFLLVLLLSGGAPGLALAQAEATATASAVIVDPIGIEVAATGSSGAAPAASSAGVTQLSGGAFSVQGPGNQVVSVSVTLPANVQRVGGGGALPVTAARAEPNRTLTAGGTSSFAVGATAPSRGAPGGVYAGVAEILVNLN